MSEQVVQHRALTLDPDRASKWLVVILLFAFTLGIFGIWFGLPYVYTSDGERQFVEPAVGFITSGDLNPHWFGHPGSTVMYILGVCYALIFFFGRLFGFFSSAADFGALFVEDPTLFYLVGRGVSVVFGVATVAVVYLIGRQIGDRRIGLLAALFLALSPLHHKWTQIARTDALAALLVVLAVYFCLLYLESARQKHIMLAGFVTGLAMATKFTMGVLVLDLLVVHLLSQRRRWKNLWLAFVALGAGLFLGAPFVVLDWTNALPQLLFENRSSHPGAESLPGLSNFWWYLSAVFPQGLTWPVALLALFGGLWALAGSGRRLRQDGFLKMPRSYRKSIVLSVFPLVYFLGIGMANLKWAHWIVPLLPFGGLLAAWMLVELFDRVSIGSYVLRRLSIILLFALLVLPPAWNILRYDYLISQKDTRTLAQEWFASNVPHGTVVGSEWYTGMWWSKTIQLVEEPSLALQPVAHFRDEGAEYLVASSGVYDRFFVEPAKYEEYVSAYQEIFESLPLVIEFKPDPWHHPGPTIKVFDLRGLP